MCDLKASIHVREVGKIENTSHERGDIGNW